MSLLILTLIKLIKIFFGLLPEKIALSVIIFFLKTLVFFKPQLKKIAFSNLQLVFTGEDRRFYKLIFDKHLIALAKLIVESINLDRRDSVWVKKNIVVEDITLLERLKGEKSLLFLSGHLGSFELLAYSAPFLIDKPISVIMRRLKPQSFNDWWSSLREKSGNRMISRQGAYRQLEERLKRGENCAMLFDQNVRDRHAVFVPWFGRLAATTKSFALATIRTHAKLVIAALLPKGATLVLKLHECKVDDILEDQSLDLEKQIILITERVSNIYQDFIKEYPEGWFWMHKRWRTLAPGLKDNLYE
jgi:KDO2-lipid IV(A) lauroyltransferase